MNANARLFICCSERYFLIKLFCYSWNSLVEFTNPTYTIHNGECTESSYQARWFHYKQLLFSIVLKFRIPSTIYRLLQRLQEEADVLCTVVRQAIQHVQSLTDRIGGVEGNYACVSLLPSRMTRLFGGFKNEPCMLNKVLTTLLRL